jgi:hypothetical protein
VTGRTREAIRYALTVFIVVRVALFLLGLMTVVVVPPITPVDVPGWPAGPLPDPGVHNVFTAWERFDALWFLRIADGGYVDGDGSAAFFPLFPMIVRAVSWSIGGHPFAAAMLVSNVAFAAALCILYLFTAEERSDETARRTVLLLGAGPASLFFYAPYTEPLFLVLALLAFRAARRGSWALAGGAAALAGATRSVGILVAGAIAVEAFQQRFEGRRGSLVRGLAAAVVGTLGLAAYLFYWQLKGDDWLAPLHQQATWQREFQPPWETLSDATVRAFGYLGQLNGGYWLIDWLLVVPILAAAVYVVARYRLAYAFYVVAGLLVPLSYVFEPRPLMSMPRFVLPLFPAFWALADISRRLRIPRTVLVGVSAALLGVLTLLFVNWYYIF